MAGFDAEARSIWIIFEPL